MTHRGLSALLAALLLLCVIAGCTSPTASGPPGIPAVFPDAQVRPLVAALPHRTVTPLPTAALAPGLLPPTNRWFSGLVFGAAASTVLPLPLSFQQTADGYRVGVPDVHATADAVQSVPGSGLTIHLGADSQLIQAYDAASVTIRQRAGGRTLGDTTLAEGVPIVWFTARSTVHLSWGTAFRSVGGSAWAADLGGFRYGFASDGEVARTGSSVRLRAGERIGWFVAPRGADATAYERSALHPVTSTTVAYAVSGLLTTTTIRYRTTDDVPVVVAAMRHQYAARIPPSGCATTGYPSVFGQLRPCRGPTLSWSTPTVAPAGSLDLARLPDAERAELAAQVTADASDLGTPPDDTYFAGKYLGRLTGLYGVARQVGAPSAAAVVRARIVEVLDEWMDPNGCEERAVHCFVYDPAAHGVVGLAPSFGSDVFNDHHFHYGYFLYAAGVVAADDPSLARRWAPVMDLLAADIATQGPSSAFPDQRVFDAYAGHSWAGGTGISADGNNQESASEAVNAWNGLALWAAASHQTHLAAEAEWMLSLEAASAKAYWTDFPLGTPAVAGYAHQVVSTVWGGRRQYATFFSEAPSAKLAITLLPMGPASTYLAGDPNRIASSLAEAAPDGFAVAFGDQLLMYSALRSPDAARAAVPIARDLPATSIDAGDSRSYLLAWTMSHATG